MASSARWTRLLGISLVVGLLAIGAAVGVHAIRKARTNVEALAAKPDKPKPSATRASAPKKQAVAEQKKQRQQTVEEAKQARAAAAQQRADAAKLRTVSTNTSADSKLATSPATKKPLPRRRMITPVDAVKVAPGFLLELIRTAELDEGSWICMSKDDQGRLIISGQPGQGIFRATLKDGKIAQWEPLTLPVSGAMGMLYAHDSLYLTCEGDEGSGLYRCRDTDADDQFDQFEKLFAFGGSTAQSTREHGPHGLELGPDGKIYCIIGDRTPVVEGVSATSPHRHHQEDIVPRPPLVGPTPTEGEHYPAGYVLRFNADGTEREVFAGGLRNAYDLTFNADGELFYFDNEMDLDWGMPWYRPARIDHCVSGGEYGWRATPGKWSNYFEDALPPVGEVGLAAPTGIASGRGAKFPAKYQRALFMLDWMYGRVLVAHLQPNGASYTATWENLIEPRGDEEVVRSQPFNLTDLTIGDDGAMYFVVGGRNARGSLYRLTYTGTESTEAAALVHADGAEARKQRQQLEKWHGHSAPEAIDEIWPHLSSGDRSLRYAARIALESQPTSAWKERAFAEKNNSAALTALLALTRVADPKEQPDVQQALLALTLKDASRSEQLRYLRTWNVSLARHDNHTSAESKTALIEQVDPLVPSPDEELNHEAMRLLIHVQAPSAVAKGLALIKTASTQQEQLFYLLQMRNLSPELWALEQRVTFLRYFGKDRPPAPSESKLAGYFAAVGRDYVHGGTFYTYLTSAYWEAIATFSSQEREDLATVIETVNQKIMPEFETPAGLPLVKKWTVEELQPFLAEADHSRNFERGRRAFINAQCIKCHRCTDEGGAGGPDLTAVARRFTRQQILESIVQPSKVISDQYEHVLVSTDDGQVISGKVVEESTQQIILLANHQEPVRMTIDKKRIEELVPSKVSPMPEHLIDVLNREEILDLIAFLESEGKERSPPFVRQ